jgi:hypothetical protein
MPADRLARKAAPLLERLEDRVVLAGGLADLAMLSAATTDSRSVTFRYEVTLPGQAVALTAEVAFFRSNDPAFSPADDVPIGSQVVQRAAGIHTVTASLSDPLAIDPSHPYVLAVADPLGVIAESHEGDNTASFRIFTIGAVSHGFELTPGASAWVDVMADSLEQAGYDVGIAFHWDALSDLPIPGMTTLAGSQLSNAVRDAVASLAPEAHPGDVFALHLIGHSRGAVVISQAALDLERLEGMLPALAPLRAGPLKMTFLDAHPANNAYSGTLYSAAPTLLGLIGTAAITTIQSAMRDPNVVVPASADWAEVYYQRTSYQKALNPVESNFLLWGEGPSDIAVLSPATSVSSLNLTDIVPGHYLVHDWYQVNVIPTLGTSSSRALAGAAEPTTPLMAAPGPFDVIPHWARPDGPLVILGLGLHRTHRIRPRR